MTRDIVIIKAVFQIWWVWLLVGWELWKAIRILKGSK